MPDIPEPLYLDARALSPDDERACRRGAAFAQAPVHVVRLEGAAPVQCIQGLLTNDVEAAGPAGFLYGAVLTPKGMILTDLWVERLEPAVTLFAPLAGATALTSVLSRYVPPRMARATVMTDAMVVLRLVGSHAADTASRAGLAVPEPGRSVQGELDGMDYILSRTPLDAPFVLQITTADPAPVQQALSAAGAVAVAQAGLDLVRALAGWPALGHEIGDKTLPQEARFDDIDAVSYSKGCYTGQETVARLHFRGHANRRIAGLEWAATPDPGTGAITVDDREVGRITSVIWSHTLDRFIGLGMVRREVEEGATVVAGGVAAVVTTLPLDHVEQ
ncbi:MAG TPA: glycine cleavage T C-terminal barrel domain-containing protein [Gemmatimonadales bacterium]|jgi:folate-binding protein YgfZ